MNPDIPAEKELLADDTVEKLISNQELRLLARSLHDQELEIGRQLKTTNAPTLQHACQRSILALLDNVPVDESYAMATPPEFACYLYTLERTVSTAPQRRRVREVARVYEHLCGNGLVMPKSIDDFHLLWESAMVGEPRWDEDHPSSAFRRERARILKGLFSDTVLQYCAEPSDYEHMFSSMLHVLEDERLAREVRAVCGFALLEWIHPFEDGNGHAGRMLLLSTIQDHYSLPTMLCFSRELVFGKSTTARCFGLLRNGEGDLSDFCTTTLSQLCEAQRDAFSIISDCRNEN